jgi:hypothetical protein
MAFEERSPARLQSRSETIPKTAAAAGLTSRSPVAIASTETTALTASREVSGLFVPAQCEAALEQEQRDENRRTDEKKERHGVRCPRLRRSGSFPQ